MEERYVHPFASGPSFLDPQISKDGTPYGPKHYKEIVTECAYISDNLHTSYNEILDISFQERVYLIEYIKNKHKATQQAIEDKQKNRKNKY